MQGLRHRKLTSKKDAIRGGSNQTGCTERSIAAGGKSKRANTKRVGAHTGSSERRSADGSNSRMVGVDDGHTRRINADGVDSTMVGGANGEHSERSSANGMNHERVANGVHSQLNGTSDGANCELNGTSDGLNSPLNGASDGGNSHGNIGSKGVRLDAPKRGRAKMSRTELKMALRSGRVELAPRGHCQFKYVNYNPKGLKYPSQVGAILKREYPGIIKVYDEHGTVVKQHPALSWNDYYWKKNSDR